MKNISTLKWISKSTKKQHPKLFLLIFLNVIFSVLFVLFAFQIKAVLGGALNGNKGELINGAIWLGVIIVSQLILRIVINSLSEHIKAKIATDMRFNMFSDIVSKKFEKISKYHSGELMNRIISDISVVSTGVSTILPNLFSAMARLLSAVIALVVLDPIFALAFCGLGILVSILIVFTRTKLKNLHKDIQEADGKSRSFMQECIENLLAVKVFSVDGKIEKKTDKLLDNSYKAIMKRKTYSVTGNAIFNFIFTLGYFFALVYGSFMIIGGSMFYDELAAILQLVNNVQMPFASLSSIIPEYYSMLASAERIIEIENIECENSGNLIQKEEVYALMQSLDFKNVSFAYKDEEVLKNINFSIKKGDFVLLSGASGSGKTTIIKLLLGVYQPNGGEINFALEDSNIKLDYASRSMFSYVPQGNMLFSGSIRENITLINTNATENEIEKVLDLSCCKEFIGELPNGIDTKIGERGLGLSEGQIQRIAIARALLSSAPIILLDESTSALDEQTEEKVLKNLKSIEKLTLIIVSHKKAPKSICNKKLYVENGNLTSAEI